MCRKKIKILLVEDEAITACALKIKLEHAGYEVQKPCATGEAAVETMKTQLADVVLMDIHLAGAMDGIQAAREISSFCDAPIIFTTGYSSGDIRVKAQPLRPAAILMKPLLFRDVVCAITDIFYDHDTVT